VTTQNRGSAYEVDLSNVSFLRKGSVANVQGLGSVPVVGLERKLGDLPASTMFEIKQAFSTNDDGAIAGHDAQSRCSNC
jgi:mRNA interferase MazF